MRSQVRKMAEAALLLALGILLPMAFHGIPNAGQVFLPMHIPALIAGFMLGPLWGLFVGAMSPLLSSLLTGMPVLAMMPGMVLEIGLYGFSSGVFYKVIKTKVYLLDIYLTLVLALLIGKCGKGIYDLALYTGRGDAYGFALFFTTYFVTAWPGLLIQFTVVPALLAALTETGFLRSEDRSFLPYLGGKALARREAEYFNGAALSYPEKTTAQKAEIMRLLEKCALRKEERILEVGCGDGALARILLAQGYDVHAIDVSLRMVERARAKDPLHESRYKVADYLAYKDKEPYDVIVLLDSYPHFLDTRAFRRKAKDLLRENGRLLILQDRPRKELNGILEGKDKARLSRPLKSPGREWTRLWLSFRKEKVSKEDGKGYLLALRRR